MVPAHPRCAHAASLETDMMGKVLALATDPKI